MNELSHRALELIYYLTENRTRKISTVLVCSASFFILGKFMKSSNIKIDPSEILVKKDDKKTKGNVDKNFLKNLTRLLKVCIPKLVGRENLSMSVLVVSLVGRTFLSIYMAEITSNIVKNIVKKDLTEFLTNILILGGLSLPGAIINSMIDYMQKELSLYFRENLCNDFQDKMLENMSYYKITNLDSRIKNPDQIFTSDIEKFSSSLASLFVNFTKPFLDIVLFIKKLSETIGYSGPGMLVGWFIVSGLLMKIITPSFGKLAAIQQSLEGKFRANHKKLMVHSEEIAFYNGNVWEMTRLSETFKILTSHMKSVQFKKFLMGIFDSMLVKFGATIVGTIALALPVFFDTFKKYSIKNKSDIPAVITKDYIKNSSLLISLSKSIGRIIISYKDIQNLAGYLSSVNELDQVIKEVARGDYKRTQVDSSLAEKYVGGTVGSDDFIEFNDVPIITPNGELLIKNINFKILPSQHTFIAGANGCGKSSLFRVLAELWPLKSGSIKKPNCNEIFYVPQKPYLPTGNLRDQIIYPLSYEDYIAEGGKDEYLLKLLESVDISHIYKRETEKFDAVKNWKFVLSGGEKQRVNMARLYFHKPKFAILDECTSAVSVDVEDKMYSQAKAYGITLITCSHRKSLWKFHDYILNIKEDSVDFTKMNEELLAAVSSKNIIKEIRDNDSIMDEKNN